MPWRVSKTNVATVQEANRIFGAIDSALKATEEVSAARASLPQPEQPAQPAAARSHSTASPGSSQGGPASDKLYGSSPESASHVQPASSPPKQEAGETALRDGQAATDSLSPRANGVAPPAGQHSTNKSMYLGLVTQCLWKMAVSFVNAWMECCLAEQV